MRGLFKARGRLTVIALALWLLGGSGAALEARDMEFTPSVNEQVAAARQIAPQIGVEIYDLEARQTVYAYNSDNPRILASNTKLFTTAAALDRLGPHFVFQTPVLVRGSVEGNTLRGDLAIVGGGDPNLSGRQYFGDSYGAFREWIAAVKDLGAERIDGDVLLVDGLFDREWVHPDWPEDQLSRWYEAPVSALSFNDNCVLVKVEPSHSAGSPARASIFPPLGLFEIANTAITTSRSRDQWLNIDRFADDGEKLKVAGKIYKRTEVVDKWVAVPDPVRYFGAAFLHALEEEGLTLSGRVRVAKQLDGSDWRVLTTHHSDLLTTIEVINKRSQNFYAESLLKLMGARLCAEGSWDAGTRVIREFLDEIGLDREAYRLADGSGMSRNNRSTPRQMIRLLEHMYHHPSSKEFLASLPYSGERDLRWEKRLADPPYAGNVLAKTGSLRAVSTLSGYAKARSGKVYAFSLLLNETKSLSRARAAQDAIVRALIDRG